MYMPQGDSGSLQQLDLEEARKLLFDVRKLRAEVNSLVETEFDRAKTKLGPLDPGKKYKTKNRRDAECVETYEQKKIHTKRMEILISASAESGDRSGDAKKLLELMLCESEVSSVMSSVPVNMKPFLYHGEDIWLPPDEKVIDAMLEKLRGQDGWLHSTGIAARIAKIGIAYGGAAVAVTAVNAGLALTGIGTVNVIFATMLVGRAMTGFFELPNVSVSVRMKKLLADIAIDLTTRSAVPVLLGGVFSVLPLGPVLGHMLLVGLIDKSNNFISAKIVSILVGEENSRTLAVAREALAQKQAMELYDRMRVTPGVMVPPDVSHCASSEFFRYTASHKSTIASLIAGSAAAATALRCGSDPLLRSYSDFVTRPAITMMFIPSVISITSDLLSLRIVNSFLDTTRNAALRSMSPEMQARVREILHNRVAISMAAWGLTIAKIEAVSAAYLLSVDRFYDMSDYISGKSEILENRAEEILRQVTANSEEPLPVYIKDMAKNLAAQRAEEEKRESWAQYLKGLGMKREEYEKLDKTERFKLLDACGVTGQNLIIGDKVDGGEWKRLEIFQKEQSKLWSALKTLPVMYYLAKNESKAGRIAEATEALEQQIKALRELSKFSGISMQELSLAKNKLRPEFVELLLKREAAASLLEQNSRNIEEHEWQKKEAKVIAEGGRAYWSSAEGAASRREFFERTGLYDTFKIKNMVKVYGYTGAFGNRKQLEESFIMPDESGMAECSVEALLGHLEKMIRTDAPESVQKSLLRLREIIEPPKSVVFTDAPELTDEQMREVDNLTKQILSYKNLGKVPQTALSKPRKSWVFNVSFYIINFFTDRETAASIIKRVDVLGYDYGSGGFPTGFKQIYDNYLTKLYKQRDDEVAGLRENLQKQEKALKQALSSVDPQKDRASEVRRIFFSERAFSMPVATQAQTSMSQIQPQQQVQQMQQVQQLQQHVELGSREQKYSSSVEYQSSTREISIQLVEQASSFVTMALSATTALANTLSLTLQNALVWGGSSVSGMLNGVSWLRVLNAPVEAKDDPLHLEKQKTPALDKIAGGNPCLMILSGSTRMMQIESGGKQILWPFSVGADGSLTKVPDSCIKSGTAYTIYSQLGWGAVSGLTKSVGGALGRVMGTYWPFMIGDAVISGVVYNRGISKVASLAKLLSSPSEKSEAAKRVLKGLIALECINLSIKRSKTYSPIEFAANVVDRDSSDVNKLCKQSFAYTSMQTVMLRLTEQMSRGRGVSAFYQLMEHVDKMSSAAIGRDDLTFEMAITEASKLGFDKGFISDMLFGTDGMSTTSEEGKELAALIANPNSKLIKELREIMVKETREPIKIQQSEFDKKYETAGASSAEAGELAAKVRDSMPYRSIIEVDALKMAAGRGPEISFGPRDDGLKEVALDVWESFPFRIIRTLFR